MDYVHNSEEGPLSQLSSFLSDENCNIQTNYLLIQSKNENALEKHIRSMNNIMTDFPLEHLLIFQKH